ncbi:Hsp70 family protein [Sodalis sp. RH23]|uniref:Hsp70 family protein n=1 Tax=unclassified Sodalis (in: enterobacteria) TaxID=2636512 RepID=UPI0039B410FC
MTVREVLGIDLGTTNSAASLWLDGRPVLVPNRHGHLLTPSVVGLDDHGNILIGQSAYARLISHPHMTKASFKRHMGSSTKIQIGHLSFRAEEISALLLRQLKEDVETWNKGSFTDAVITVPAYFNDVQRRAVKTAGQLAGLNVVRLLNEPTAASLAFGLLENHEQKYLTFDLGGGTFDVSIIDMFEGVVEVRASCGDVMLGGDDFSEAICRWMLEVHPDLEQYIPQIHPSLLAQAEAMKRSISLNSNGKAELTWGGKEWLWSLDEHQFAQSCQPLLERLQQPIMQALHDARFSLSDLDHILLVGGATRMPLIRQTVARLFGRFPRYDLNPDEAVALGAGVQAGMIMADSAVEEIILTDVMPFTLGIEIAKQHSGQLEEGFFLPLIERNTFLPVSIMKRVCTVFDNQKVVLVKIFQGEARRVKDNVFLGEMSVEVPPKKAEEVSLDVRFTYTVDGLLEIQCSHDDATVPICMVIEKVPGQMSEKQIAESLQRLSNLKQNPRDNPINRALLDRGARLFNVLLGDERQWADTVITAFEQALDSQDPRQIALTRQRVEAALDRLDDGTS